MCDYSAEDVKSRKAKVGDRLVTANISFHTTGLVSPTDRSTAVCMCMGSRLTVANVPDEVRHVLGLDRKSAVLSATFAQRNVEGADPGTYLRDGVIFDDTDGKIVLLKDLGLEVEMVVESIPGIADDRPAPTAATENAVERELIDA